MPSRLGAPERVLVADPDGAGGHRVVSLLYRGGTVRLDAFDGSLDIVFHKRSLGADVTLTQVGGEFAIWVGGPHALAYVDRSGTERVATARLSAATLIWEQGWRTWTGRARNGSPPRGCPRPRSSGSRAG
ncbi:hypothetical protein [Micromonospora sp. M42]|uniref:hypothetical protein n=1 Tax=Micromonospora sp. M42 TaxID=457406 RepID=UPI001CB77FEA|nr:hypothetical protein [Micromonospora sp. M42]